MAHDQAYTNYINSEAWFAVRQQALKIHGRFCARCKKTSKLYVHHKTYKNFMHEDVQNDLVPLCQDCHKKLHKFCKKRNIDLFHGSELFISNASNIHILRSQKTDKKSKARRRQKLTRIYQRENEQSRRLPPGRMEDYIPPPPAGIPIKKRVTVDLLKFMTSTSFPRQRPDPF